MGNADEIGVNAFQGGQRSLGKAMVRGH